jgi:hypothetical protein
MGAQLKVYNVLENYDFFSEVLCLPGLGGCWGLHAFFVYMFDAPPRGRQKARVKPQAPVSNILPKASSKSVSR